MKLGSLTRPQLGNPPQEATLDRGGIIIIHTRGHLNYHNSRYIISDIPR
jgi:hypothetical protein